MIKVKNDEDSAEIWINGNIVDDDEGGMLEAWDMKTGYQWPSGIKEQLDAIDNEEPLTVHINSDGGSVPAGVAIANMIKNHKGPTKAIVDGWACSIATQIFFAADTREIPSNAYLMIHKPSCVVSGNADDMLEAADALDTIQSGLETTYNNAAKDGITPEKIHEMVNNTTWLTGNDAAEVFDVSVTGATKTAACAGSAMKMFNSIPKEIHTTSTDGMPQPAVDTGNDEFAANVARVEFVNNLAKVERITEEIRHEEI